jgi:hypothetical protein
MTIAFILLGISIVVIWIFFNFQLTTAIQLLLVLILIVLQLNMCICAKLGARQHIHGPMPVMPVPMPIPDVGQAPPYNGALMMMTPEQYAGSGGIPPPQPYYGMNNGSTEQAPAYTTGLYQYRMQEQPPPPYDNSYSLSTLADNLEMPGMANRMADVPRQAVVPPLQPPPNVLPESQSRVPVLPKIPRVMSRHVHNNRHH